MLRLLKQLSDVYSIMRISALQALVPFMPFSGEPCMGEQLVLCMGQFVPDGGHILAELLHLALCQWERKPKSHHIFEYMETLGSS